MYVFIAISRNGLELAVKLRSVFDGSLIYTTKKHHAADYLLIDSDLTSFTGELFRQHTVLVFIMATGIVVRCIAPHLRHKALDPAVVVVDETGKFAISLLSGHLGGANEVATAISAVINAIPVITTASDMHGLQSVDMLAKQYSLIIDSLEDAKYVTANMIDGQQIAIVNETLCMIDNSNSEELSQAVIYISHRSKITQDKLFSKLLVPNLIVGIGCRRGTASQSIIEFITHKFCELNIDCRCIAKFATIDIKHDEEGIIAAAQHFSVPVLFIDKALIQEVESLFTESDFVHNAVGVGSVCEPSAYLAGNKEGRFILNKTVNQGITISVFETSKYINL